MTRDEIHPAMREALGTFALFRALGFRSDDIFFHQNADEPPGPEPRGMMFAVLKVQGKHFSISVGVVDTTYDAWIETWTTVATAARDGQVVDLGRIIEESLAFKVKVQIMMAIENKGIRIPAGES